MMYYTSKEGGRWKPLRLGLSKEKVLQQLRDRSNWCHRGAIPVTPLTRLRNGWKGIRVQSDLFERGVIWDSFFRGPRPII